METLHLSPRLAAIAALVPQDARVIDVGTDHAMLPVYLAQTARAAHIWASDINAGPLQSAERLVRSAGVSDRVNLRQTDGLRGFTRADADCVVIAGMGGETMLSILIEAAWTREDVLLILEPQTKQDVLRRWLVGHGYAVTSEQLVRDAGRIYPFLTVTGGTSALYSEAEYHLGRWEQIGGDPLLPEYLCSLIKRISHAAPYDADARKLLEELITMKSRRKDHA